MPPLLAEQVLALAPDAAAAKAGRDLAVARKWLSAQHDDRAAWGECQGSGKLPYQVQADCDGPAYRCSCPSRKLPCKHVLGLLLLVAGGATGSGERPAWVDEWLAARDGRAQQRAAAAPAASTAGTAAPDTAAAGGRRDARLAKVGAGFEDLAVWLADLVRLGLAAAARQPAAYWNTAAARLVDAQAPGMAGLVRELGTVPASGHGWEERMLARLGRIHLLSEGFGRLESLPAENRADILAAAGIPLRREEVLGGATLRDCWIVAGERLQTDGRLRMRRTWLVGRDSGRAALLLAFAAGGLPLEPGPLPGTALAAELAFYPGAWPLRALVKEQWAQPQRLAELPDGVSIGAAVREFAAALAANPWLEQLPMTLSAVVPSRDGDSWVVCDAAGSALPLSTRFDGGWKLLALSGGHPVSLFGEWDGAALLPLGVAAEGRYHAL